MSRPGQRRGGGWSSSRECAFRSARAGLPVSPTRLPGRPCADRTPTRTGKDDSLTPPVRPPECALPPRPPGAAPTQLTRSPVNGLLIVPEMQQEICTGRPADDPTHCTPPPCTRRSRTRCWNDSDPRGRIMTWCSPRRLPALRRRGRWPQDPEKVSARWRTLRTRLKLAEEFRIHDWRHSKVTNDLEAGENPVEPSPTSGTTRRATPWPATTTAGRMAPGSSPPLERTGLACHPWSDLGIPWAAGHVIGQATAQK